MWDSNQLKKVVKSKIGESLLVIISNREPYMHVMRHGEVEIDKPASGLITALDPVMKACGGLWVAYGSGSADKRVVDKKSCVQVPPDNPQYTLKRVWLSKEEEKGYYYGFSNEALWPLCHTSYIRPEFRASDWEMYKKVNEIFANATLEAIGDEKAFVWVQDYHFALLPALLKEKRPDILVAQFWHIPWPNPETFRIIPWKEEILWGLLGNDLLGFHVRHHCDNFLDTVNQTLEARVDRERSSVVHHGGLETRVVPFPISVDFEQIQKDLKEEKVMSLAARLKSQYNLGGKKIVIGVDRLDYTKGIKERLHSFNLFLEENPQYLGKVVFLQLAARSRSRIERYQELHDDVITITEEINWRYSTEDWEPTILATEPMRYPDVLAFYQIADVCLVNSLHDGMNLVSKEFLSTKEDGKGVLILSNFTGASRELLDAILINPFDIDATAKAIKQAIEMPEEEQALRLERLRGLIKHNNIYRWAGEFIEHLSQLEPMQI